MRKKKIYVVEEFELSFKGTLKLEDKIKNIEIKFPRVSLDCVVLAKRRKEFLKIANTELANLFCKYNGDINVCKGLSLVLDGNNNGANVNIVKYKIDKNMNIKSETNIYIDNIENIKFSEFKDSKNEWGIFSMIVSD